MGHCWSRFRQRRSSSTKVLLIPLVMEKVARSLPTRDLLTLRLTCSLWNSVMVDVLRAKASAIECGNYSWPATIGPLEIVESLVDTMSRSKSGHWPFGSLYINVRPRQPRDDEEDDVDNSRQQYLFDQVPFLRLISLWSQHLTRLSICVQQFSSSSNLIRTQGLRNLLFNLTPMLTDLDLDIGCIEDETGTGHHCAELPRLKSLTLKLDYSDQAIVTILVADLLRLAPGLETLALDNQSMTDIGLQCMLDAPSVCGSLRSLRVDSVNSNCLSKLTDLSVRPVNPVRLGQFQTKSPHHDYDVTARHEPQIAAQLIQFLSSQSTSLRTLSLKTYCMNLDSDLRIQLPHLGQLKYLEMSISGKPIVQVVLENCPVLKSLTLINNSTSGSRSTSGLIDWIHGDRDTGANVTHLALKSQFLSSNLLLPNLTSIFTPGTLTSLTIQVKRGNLPSIWTTWTLLKVVHIKVCELDRDLDPELTGIPREVCDHFREQLTAGPASRPRVDYEHAKRAQNCPGIQDMKFLRSFALEAEMALVVVAPAARRAYNYVSITDVSGYYAFATPNTVQLDNIHILNCAQISEACERAIRVNLGLGSCLTFIKF